mmetsp:Transcript_26943/g.75930  ORF Transcript_26943/g.75930 Transcript_26943/m.75930 type:complete len:516 (-) Transcript_26943:541-2088(-)|eukprot:CAMPEP_0117680490 /NCGR_PEP_ID=MMETSP0804-20121206/18389_1 /TAXON_ID=1074897 /ORGANISM="Tetraselmis astigmatica, Strain CCMP880" /LENGTH=515 /DNA_ID=CAMNT_0005490009 /DNA_START=497 /DNA_END=2044 /DNA_ORIENTATION=-
MEWPFRVPGLGDQELITKWDAKRIAGLSTEIRERLRRVVDTAGELSAKAQGLGAVITDLSRVQSHNHILYLAASVSVTGTKVLGMLKLGNKKLFIRVDTGELKEIEPLCVLDFYVHESCQRIGLGGELMDHMLHDLRVTPARLAYDRPSSKLLPFLRKRFGLSDYIPQSNNFVVFRKYFSSAKPSRQDSSAQWASVNARPLTAQKGARPPSGQARSVTRVASQAPSNPKYAIDGSGADGSAPAAVLGPRTPPMDAAQSGSRPAAYSGSGTRALPSAEPYGHHYSQQPSSRTQDWPSRPASRTQQQEQQRTQQQQYSPAAAAPRWKPSPSGPRIVVHNPASEEPAGPRYGRRAGASPSASPIGDARYASYHYHRHQQAVPSHPGNLPATHGHSPGDSSPQIRPAASQRFPYAAADLQEEDSLTQWKAMSQQPPSQPTAHSGRTAQPWGQPGYHSPQHGSSGLPYASSTVPHSRAPSIPPHSPYSVTAAVGMAALSPARAMALRHQAGSGAKGALAW